VTAGVRRLDFVLGQDIESTTRQLADFSLADENPNSPTFGLPLGPASFSGSVSAYYFTHPG
jgi:hypothetical protein